MESDNTTEECGTGEGDLLPLECGTDALHVLPTTKFDPYTEEVIELTY